MVRLADRLGPSGAVLPFGPDDAHLMTTIAGVLAVALHRALRHQPVLSPILHARPGPGPFKPPPHAQQVHRGALFRKEALVCTQRVPKVSKTGQNCPAW